MEAVITHKRWKKTGIFKAHQRDFKCKIQQQINIEGYISMNVLALAAIALNLVLVEAACEVASALSFPSFQSFFTLKSTVGCTMSSAQVMLAHQTVARPCPMPAFTLCLWMGGEGLWQKVNTWQDGHGNKLGIRTSDTNTDDLTADEIHIKAN